jgi:hypothetical protein
MYIAKYTSAFILMALATPALADSVDNLSDASKDSATAVAEIAEAGVRTVVGVAALPASVAAGGSVVAGAIVEGVGDSTVQVGLGAAHGADEMARFANAPLSVSDDVVVGPPPQGAPNVPAAPKAAAR